MEKLGYCIGTTKPNKVIFITDKVARVGQFVVLKYYEGSEEKKLLGMIQSLYRENPYLPDTTKLPRQVEGINKFSKDDTSLKGEINILGEIIDVGNEIFLQLPKTPPLPASEVYKADPNILKKLFGETDKKYIRIGRLLSEEEEIPVYINIEQVVLRHLAILAVTGAGKSNTVSVLLKNIVDLNGTVLVFDFHGEYKDAKIRKGNQNRVNEIKPLINPLKLHPREFASLVGIKSNANIQLRYFQIALEHTKEKLKEEKGEDWHIKVSTDLFMYRFKEYLEDLANEESELREKLKGNKIRDDSLFEVLNKLEDFEKELGHIIDIHAKPIVEKIKFGYINVIDFSEIDEDVADIISSNILKTALDERKRAIRKGKESSAIPFPILIVIEEAHILAGDKRNTQAKYYISRIAREGRKFGLGLTIVTQRPKGLDKEILSQMNNMIILKLVEPEDQKHVQSASESLSQELMSYLPSLNPGEAIIIGNMTKIPLLVKIDKAKEKIEGHDLKVVDEWLSLEKNSSNETLQQKASLDAIDMF
jgi:DNA helicase HerA-like ATPase